MLGFVISTIALFMATYALNRYFDTQGFNGTFSRKTIVMAAATFISIGSGWIVDKVDGDAEAPHVSLTDAIQDGDPLQIAKLLAGINN